MKLAPIDPSAAVAPPRQLRLTVGKSGRMYWAFAWIARMFAAWRWIA